MKHTFGLKQVQALDNQDTIEIADINGDIVTPEGGLPLTRIPYTQFMGEIAPYCYNLVTASRIADLDPDRANFLTAQAILERQDSFVYNAATKKWVIQEEEVEEFVPEQGKAVKQTRKVTKPGGAYEYVLCRMISGLTPDMLQLVSKETFWSLLAFVLDHNVNFKNAILNTAETFTSSAHQPVQPTKATTVAQAA